MLQKIQFFDKKDPKLSLSELLPFRIIYSLCPVILDVIHSNDDMVKFYSAGPNLAREIAI
jgi:hypothetical protein